MCGAPRFPSLPDFFFPHYALCWIHFCVIQNFTLIYNFLFRTSNEISSRIFFRAECVCYTDQWCQIGGISSIWDFFLCPVSYTLSPEFQFPFFFFSERKVQAFFYTTYYFFITSTHLFCCCFCCCCKSVMATAKALKIINTRIKKNICRYMLFCCW